ncbi:unnamed protein product [Albugo candida]|uniref:Uncharacterized protein n=1 Tax=Albugo candida TaxID=65357 RepID=A0A024GSY0_9STRA|nr:unnamed protein product [Albugo candida]|eukprot:CCI49836.1 unnamed protein product [Albugo candida]
MATLDGKTLFQNDNCVEAYPGYPAIIKVSYESCVTDTCLFIFYAVALHGEKVQIYKKCVTVTNGEKGKPKSDPGKAPGAGTPPQGTPPQGTPPKETPPSNPPAQVQPQPKVEVPEPNPKHKDEPSGDNKPHPTIKHDVVSPTSSNPPAPAPHGETSDKRKKCREVE